MTRAARHRLLRAAVAGVVLLPAAPAAAAPERFHHAVGYDVVDSGDTCTTLCQLGRSGGGAGQLGGPGTVSASGNEIFVSELDVTLLSSPNPRISVFDVAAGQFVRALGQDVAGPGTKVCTTSCAFSRVSADSLNAPAGSALSGGELFVADRNRVAVLDPATGVLRRAFGLNVGGLGVNLCTPPATPCAGAGNIGTSAGALGGTVGVAVFGGHVFVAEGSAGNRVSVFTTAGAFEYAFGKNVKVGGGDLCTSATGCQAGSAGGGAGLLSGVVAIAISGDGSKLFLSEAGNERVSVFNPTTGAFLRAFGKDVGGPNTGVDSCTVTCFGGVAGSALGQFAGVRGLAVSGGELAVAEFGNNRVSFFDTATGAFVRAIGRDVGGPGFNVCAGICQAGAFGDTPALGSPFGVAVAGGRVVVTQYVLLAANLLSFDVANRVLVFDAQTGAFERGFGKSVLPGASGEQERCSAVCEAGRAGGRAGQLAGPQGAAVADGRLFVADTDNNRVLAYDVPSGTFVRAFGKDVGGAGVNVCTSTCQAGIADSAAAALSGPVGVAASGGLVFVADAANNRVMSFSAATGAFVRGYGKNVGGANTTTCAGLCQAGKAGAGAGELDEPAGVAVAGSELLVSERGNGRVSVYTVATGVYTRTFGAGRLAEPSGIAVSGGEVFVGERANRRVSVFDAASGAFVRALGRNVGGSGTSACTSSCRAGGAGPGTGRLDVPVALAVVGDELYVGESNNNRVSVLDAATGALRRAFGDGVGGAGADTCVSSCQPGGDGYAAGQFSGPSGLAVADSWVYVSDRANNRIDVYSTADSAPPVADVPAPAPLVAGPPLPPAVAKPAPAMKAKLSIARTTLAVALRRGLLVTVNGAKPGRLRLVARQGKKIVASGSGTVARAGTARIRMTFTRSAKRSLRRARLVKLKISGPGLALTITLRRGK